MLTRLLSFFSSWLAYLMYGKHQDIEIEMQEMPRDDEKKIYTHHQYKRVKNYFRLAGFVSPSSAALRASLKVSNNWAMGL